MRDAGRGLQPQPTGSQTQSHNLGSGGARMGVSLGLVVCQRLARSARFLRQRTSAFAFRAFAKWSSWHSSARLSRCSSRKLFWVASLCSRQRRLHSSHISSCRVLQVYTSARTAPQRSPSRGCGMNAGYIQFWTHSSTPHLFDIDFSTVAVTEAKPVDIGGIYGRFEPELHRESLVLDAGGSGGRRTFELRTRWRLQIHL